MFQKSQKRTFSATGSSRLSIGVATAFYRRYPFAVDAPGLPEGLPILGLCDRFLEEAGSVCYRCSGFGESVF